MDSDPAGEEITLPFDPPGRSLIRMMLRVLPPVLLVVACTLQLFLTGCSSPEDRMQRHLERGDDLRRAGKFDDAESQYRAALAYQSDAPQVLGRLGLLAFRQGRTLSGYFLLEGTIANLPNEPELQIAYGLASHAVGRTAEARTVAKKILETSPGDEEALLLLAETCVTTRDNEEARRLILEARDRSTNPAPHHVALGVLHRAKQETAEAEREFRQAIEADPKSAAAYSHLGSFYMREEGGKDRAREMFQRAAELSPLRSPRRIKYVEFLIRDRDLEEADRQIAAITKDAPDYVPAWSMRMILAYQQGQLDESLEAAGKVLARDRMNYDAMMQRAAIKLVRDDYDGVIGELQKAEEFYDRSPQVKYQLALAHLKKNELFQCKEKLEQALRLSPNFDDAILLLAEVNLQQGQALAAITGLTALLERRPEVPRTYLLLAQAHRANGDLQAALDTLSRLAAGFPNAPQGPHLAGLVLLEANRRDLAREAFEDAIKRVPDFWPSLEMLLDFDLAEKRTAEAAARVEDLLAKHPAVPSPWLFRAKIRLLQGDWAGAETDLLQAVAIDPQAQYAYRQLARLYFESNRTQEALEKLTHLATQEPTTTNLMQLAMLHTSLGRHDEARQQYERIIARDPKFSPALNNLAWVYSEHLNVIDKAHDLAKEARDAAPNDPVVADTLGWILVRKGQYDSALPLLQMAAERLAADATIQYHYGMVQYHLGREETARQVLGAVLAANPEAGLRADAERRLAVLAIDPAPKGTAARTQLEQAIAADPSDPLALARLGAWHAGAGEATTAGELYERALKVNNRSTSVLLALVDLYMGPLAKPERARELARAARTAAPNDGNIAWRLGRLAFNSGDFPWSVVLLQDAVRFLPQEPAAQLDLAQAYYSVGRIGEAEAALRPLLAASTDGAVRERATRMHHYLQLAAAVPVTPEAVAEAHQLLAQERDFVPALMVVGLAHQQHGEDQQARETFEAALARYPQFAPAMRQLAILWGDRLGDDTKAESYATRAREVFPEDPELAYQLGAINFRRADYPNAVRLLQECTQRRRDHASAHFFLGLAQFQLKNPSESRVALQRALELNLPPQEATEARRVLESLSRGGGAALGL